MTQDFKGLHVVVTGGTGALGGAVVEALLERGAECRIPCVDESELNRFPRRDDPRVRIDLGVDLRDEQSVERFFSAIPSVWASIHVAGGFAMAPIEKTSLADWRAMMDMNAATCFLCCREAVKRIRAAKDPRGGRIVNVCARPALIPTPGMLAYAASKSAVASITRCLAEELKDERIWVNAVAPSIMDTAANRSAMPDADHSAWPKVGEVAEAIVFLSSPDNAVCHGGVVPVYGRA